MKQQQLFNSFCVAGITTVLATQPAWADTVQVTAVRLNPTVSGIEVMLKIPKSASPPVFTFSYGQTFVADIANTQLHLRKGDTFSASNPTDSITAVTVTPLNAKSIRVSVIAKAGVPVAKVVHSDKGLVLSLKATAVGDRGQAQNHPVKGHQIQTSSISSGQLSHNEVRTALRSNPAADKSNQPVAQSASPVPTPTVSPQLPTSDIPTQPTPAPRYLNPSPNPLQLPTRPGEVRIQGTQPITLQQAFELARRNNRTLQSAELTLESDRAALREAEAALYPTFTANVQVTNSGNAFINSNGTTSSTLSNTGTSTIGGTSTTGGSTIGGTGITGGSAIGGTGITGGSTIGTTTTGASPVGTTTTGASPIGTTTTGTTGIVPTTTTSSNTTATPVTTTTGSSATPASTTLTTSQVVTNPTGNTGTGTTTGTTGTGTTTGTTGTGTTTGTTGTGATTVTNQARYSSTDLTGTLALNYNLYTSGGRTASIRAAKERVRYDQLGVEATAQQLRLDVSNYYYNLQSADQSVLIYQAAVTNAQASLRDALAQERAGVGTRFDTLQAQVQLANSIQNLNNSEANQQSARRQLAQELSIAQSVDLSAADPVQIAGLWNLSLEDSIILAFKNRAELEQYLAQRNIAEQNRRLALSNLGPQVSLFGEYRVTDNLANSIAGTNPQTGIRYGNLGGSDQYVAGAQVNLLLFDGGLYRAQAAVAEANKAIAETSFANERDLIRFDVENYYASLQANLSNVQLSTVSVAEATESLRLARLRFQAGVGTQTDVISAENNLTNAQGSRINAILNYNKSLASLQRSISSGRPR